MIVIRLMSQYNVTIFDLSNKVDEMISLDNLQKLKLAFEVLYKLHLLKMHQIVWLLISGRFDCIFLCKGI